MDKIKRDGPGCYVWMRIYDSEDELRLFMCDCCLSLIPQWSLTSLSLKELEQDATQESSQGRNEEAEAESS